MYEPIPILFFLLGYTISIIMTRHGHGIMPFVLIATTLGVLIGLLSSFKAPSRDPRWKIPILRITLGGLKGGCFAAATALLAGFADLEYIGLAAILGGLSAYFQPAIKYDAVAGTNLVSGCKSTQRSAVASKMLDQASFSSNAYDGIRTLQHFRFGASGPSASYMQMLQQDLKTADNLSFGVLAILVKQLPDQPDEPALLVIQDADQLRLTQADADGISVPFYAHKINASAIVATTTYAWLQEKVSV